MDPTSIVNVLLVDDRPANLELMEAALQGLGINAVTVLSGEEALEWLDREDFAVIVLDINMPQMSGFEVMEQISQHTRARGTPVILATATTKTEAAVLQGYALGAVDVMFKPVYPEIFRAKMKVFADLFRRQQRIS